MDTYCFWRCTVDWTWQFVHIMATSHTISAYWREPQLNIPYYSHKFWIRIKEINHTAVLQNFFDVGCLGHNQRPVYPYIHLLYQATATDPYLCEVAPPPPGLDMLGTSDHPMWTDDRYSTGSEPIRQKLLLKTIENLSTFYPSSKFKILIEKNLTDFKV